jgi:hypothetical protein
MRVVFVRIHTVDGNLHLSEALPIQGSTFKIHLNCREKNATNNIKPKITLSVFKYVSGYNIWEMRR